MSSQRPTRERVAVIGSGIAGLTAAYLLQRRYDVLIFEQDNRIGGHAHTHDAPSTTGIVAVDSGFIVHNERTYPNLLRLFNELGVSTQDSEMSMSIRCEGCGLEYAGANRLSGLFAQKKNLIKPTYLRMLAEITRFHRHAQRVLSGAETGDVTLGAFLVIGGYSAYFVDHFVLPVVSAVWSSSREVSKNYPARYLFEFLHNHGMLSIKGSPQWKTVTGGSRSYVERVIKGLTAIHQSTAIRAVHRGPEDVVIRDDTDQLHHVDRIVIATHADQALQLLADPTDEERSVLRVFQYSRNETWLHTDSSVLPQVKGAKASWNYLKPKCRAESNQVLVSYHMNRLMRISEPLDYIVSLNATGRIAEESVIAKMVYEHPIYTPESVAAQRKLAALSQGRTAYAGAYHGWGFHEDGCASGVRAAAAFGVEWI